MGTIVLAAPHGRRASAVPGFGRAGDHPGLHVHRAGLAQHTGDFEQRRAAGHHIVQQGDAAALQRPDAQRVDREHAAHIGPAIGELQAGLGAVVTHAQQQSGIAAQPAPPRQRLGELMGLVVAALAQPRDGQGHRQQPVGRADLGRAERGIEPRQQALAQVQGLVVFEVLQQPVPREAVVQRRHRAVQRWRLGQATAALRLRPAKQRRRQPGGTGPAARLRAGIEADAGRADRLVAPGTADRALAGAAQQHLLDQCGFGPRQRALGHRVNILTLP
mmetsp:Transcript_62038/g.146935  ORF Transcript_62038/g.146935 Transcript_62038/m.146935 type:complete len:275 (+) Transcript_62038:1087-1911(+)